jgi:hypothetical protein
VIVLDEQINQKRVLAPLRKRFGGGVISLRELRELRPKGTIEDDAIPELLPRKKKPTFDHQCG